MTETDLCQDKTKVIISDLLTLLSTMLSFVGGTFFCLIFGSLMLKTSDCPQYICCIRLNVNWKCSLHNQLCSVQTKHFRAVPGWAQRWQKSSRTASTPWSLPSWGCHRTSCRHRVDESAPLHSHWTEWPVSAEPSGQSLSPLPASALGHTARE